MTSATATATGCHWIEEYKKSKKRKEKREKMSLQYVLMHKIKHSNPLNHTKIKCKKKKEEEEKRATCSPKQAIQVEITNFKKIKRVGGMENK